MLKYLLPITLLSATVVVAQEQEVPPFQAVQSCATFAKMAEQTAKYDETILFNGKMLQQHASGQFVNSEMIFTTNQDTGTWTLVALYQNGWACMVANGSDFVPYTN